MRTKSRPSSDEVLAAFRARIKVSTRKSRDHQSVIRRNVDDWVNRRPVTGRRGIFKNLKYNPTGCTIDRKQPLKQRGCLLVDSTSLRATLGKRRTRIPDTVEVGPQEPSLEYDYALSISGGRLVLARRRKGAYEKNLAFLQGGSRSCKQLKYVAHFICQYGITVRLFKKLSLAARLVWAGKPNPAMTIYRSVANRVGKLRHERSKHASLSESHLSGSLSSYSDW